ncbi:RDD family protein [Sphaerisporangium rufum]|uniref:RDD family protein n=1 Tax=Sphaerisporangium rufum TaxID=1381558 RepID=A0A919QXM3_9ACTN|nr:RDD family protein [Sphaerisporangium rufum]GII76014.1 RDD family protein [Sphaerisporangium rufum]
MSKQPRWTQTWLGGPRAAAGVDLGYPGQRLGLPETGPGSVGRFGRRIGALLVDWLLCTWAIARGLLGADPRTASWVGMGVFAVEYIVLVGTIGSTLGMMVFGIRVAGVSGGRPPLVSVVIRTLLLCLAVPALIYDRDQRGLHDRAARTIVLRR